MQGSAGFQLAVLQGFQPASHLCAFEPDVISTVCRLEIGDTAGWKPALRSMTLSEIKHVLATRGIQLTRSLGQSFLHDANQLRRIAEAAELSAQDRVLEIGPGLGPLTELLLAQAGEVLAIEKDQRLVSCLRERFASADNLTLIHDDALEYLRREVRDWNDWKLVANLPYSVASPILVELAQGSSGLKRLTATLQSEVARRLVAEPDSRDYGVLTLLVQLGYESLNSFKIQATCFFPPPDVDSTCITLRRRSQPLLDLTLRPTFVKIVKRSFSQRRKMMLKLLKADWNTTALQQAFTEIGIQAQARAEHVSLEQFVRLTQSLSSSSGRG
jgi:16S rRNA (adenine1518-N6/adenine1519-N6)-dimethyltransferase